MLSLDGKRNRLLFGKRRPSPEPVEQVESELAPQGVLDDLTVALSGSGRAHLYRPKDVFVDRQGRPNLGHVRIIAS